MKKLITLFFAFLALKSSMAQEISPYVIGTNSWQPPWHSGSKMNELMDDLQLAGIQMVRIGGNGAQNAGDYTKERIAQLADSIRKYGAEPIVQVPHTFTAAQTKTLIEYLNVTRGLKIKYWAIGNEPNLNNSWSVAIPVETVAKYIKTIATALKTFDPNVITIAPATAWYDNAYMGPLFVNKGAADVSGADSLGNYYVDVLDWHKYAITTGAENEGSVNSALTIINKINESRPIGKKMSWAITEINGHYSNDKATEDQKVWSFNSGQMLAETYDLAMRKGGLTICTWSIFESNGSRSDGDLSFFDLVNGKLIGRSIYYHALMLGQNMKRKYLTNTDNNSNVSISSMGDSTGFSVMIMNRSKTSGYDYSLALNGVADTAKVLKISVNAGIQKVIYGNIGAKTSLMLVFNAQGKMVKRYTYSEADALEMGAPITEVFSGKTENPGSLKIVSPLPNARIVKDSSVVVEVNAKSADGIASVMVKLNQDTLGVDIVSPYRWDATTNDTLSKLPLGTYNLYVQSISTKGDTIVTSSSFSIVTAPVLPVVSFTSPLDGDTFNQGVNLKVLNLSATHPKGIANVKLYLNGKLVRQENIAPYDWGLEGQNDAILTNLAAGAYTLKAEASASTGEIASASIKITVVNPLSVSSILSEKIKLYPNPVKNQLFIESADPIISVSILNQLGQVLMQENGGKLSMKSISMTDFSKGIYFIKINSTYENSISKIVIE